MATATVKAANYTEAQVTEMKAAYNPAASETERKAMVESLAEKFGKSAKSIVAKLAKEGVYVAKAYTSKNGEKPVKKDAHADAIGKVLNLTEPDTESLTKANKSALTKIFSALANSVPLEIESDADVATKPANVAVISRVAGLDADEQKSIMRVKASTLAKMAAVFQEEIADE